MAEFLPKHHLTPFSAARCQQFPALALLEYKFRSESQFNGGVFWRGLLWIILAWRVWLSMPEIPQRYINAKPAISCQPGRKSRLIT